MMIETRPGRFRYTVILAATGRRLERFDNLDDMPPSLRAQCLKALGSRDSGAVVIAGQAKPEPVEEPAGPARQADPASAPDSRAGRGREAWIAFWIFAVVVAAAAAAWWLAAGI
jgi:hypothetical protein